MKKLISLLYFPLAIFLIMTSNPISGQELPKPNYDESKIPGYRLPSAFKTENGRTIQTKEEWEKYRRPELIAQFETYMFGKVPQMENRIRVKQTQAPTTALNELAIRKEITIYFDGRKTGPQMTILFYLPAERQGRVPLFIGYNFQGNQTIHSDPGITMSQSWVPNRPDRGLVDNQATEKSRGVAASRWPVEMILEHGYGLATIYYGDVDPDFDDGFKNGVHQLFENKPKADEWGSIATWAWALSRAMDYLETDPDVDKEKVAVIGHSRLGKTSLWAGATDPRFAMVISNDSGCGGAALSRRKIGETVAAINTNFPHWFCDNFKQFNEKEENLPFDQHLLIGLIAPRPVYVASASEDLWADPKGEFLSAKEAEKVYALYGLEGLPTDTMPAVEEPVVGTIGYHLREGKHDITRYDWTQYLNFADRYFKD
ncbi:MAG: acetylxylan esterase [Bacteroidetes bacterium]|nr:acetylxylan esterase [Bacteroidota bacterium]